jgi:hypothetical protein
VRGAVGVAPERLEALDAVRLEPVGEGAPDAGVVLVVAGALDLHVAPVEEEPLLGVEADGSDAERREIAVGLGCAGHDRK